MLMQKRGQVTIFIIFGILILVTVFSFIYLNNYLKTKQLEQDTADKLGLDLKTQSVKNLVENCIEEVGTKSIIQLGFHGGKKDLTGPFFDEKVFDANYLYYLGEDKTSSVKEIEDDLSIMMEEHLNDCVGNFNIFKLVEFKEEMINHDLVSESFKIEQGNISASSKINDATVFFTINWPLKLKYKTMEKEISDFSIKKYGLELKRMSLFVEDFIEQIAAHPYLIDAFYLLKQNYTINMALFNNDTYTFLVTDNRSMIEGEPLRFLFAAKVNLSEGLI